MAVPTTPVQTVDPPQSTQTIPLQDPGTNIAVNAPDPTQVATVPAPQPMLQPDAAPDYTQPTVTPDRESWWRRALDTVGSIMGGDQTIHITKTPDGTMTVTHDPSTTGEKWGRVAAAMLGGAAKGLAVGQGPGGPARAAAAGAEFGQQLPQQALQQANQQAASMNAQQLAAANSALLHQKIVTQGLLSQQAGLTLAGQQADLLNRINDVTKGSPNAQVLPTVDNMPDMAKLPLSYANALQAHTNGQMVMLVTPQANGKVGFTPVIVDRAYSTRLNDKPREVLKLGVDPTTKAPTLQSTTVDPLTHTNGDIDTGNQAVIASFLTQNNNFMKANTAAQTAANAAQAASNRQPLVEAQAANQRAEAALNQTKAEAARRSLTGQPGGQPVEVDDPNFPSPANFPTGTPGIAPPPKSGNYVPAEAARAYRLSQIMRESGNNIRNIATSNPQLFGRLQGLLSQGKTIVGLSNSADDQNIARLAGSIQQYAQASAGFHTFRNKAAPAETEETSLNKFRNDPASIVAYLDSQAPAFQQTDRLVRNYEIYHTPDGPSPEARAAAVARAPNAAKFQGGGGTAPPATQQQQPAPPAGAAIQAPAGATMVYHDAQGNVTGWAVNGQYVKR